jgi:hypothetical protein
VVSSVYNAMRYLLFLALLSSTLRAQAAPRHTELATREELDSISLRGIELYEYDRAAWEATDALFKIVRPPPAEGGQYVVVHSDSYWTVNFGRLTAARDTFYTLYQAYRHEPDTTWFAGRKPSPSPNIMALLHSARAVTTAAEAFGAVQPRPYNHVAIETANGEWLVYLFPAQTVNTSWPLGADERFRISSDGLRILERHRMHITVIETPNNEKPDSAGNKRVAYFQVNVTDNRPEDTDVFAVLSRTPSLPSYVGVDGNWVYRIDPDGRIRAPRQIAPNPSR